MSGPLVVIDRVSKRFGGTQALSDVSLEIQAGEIHGIVGENGAGKSTLMNVLSGVIQQDKGQVYLDGVEVRGANPRKMQELGVATVYQELNLLPNRDAAQNIFAGREPLRYGAVVDARLMRATTRKILDRLGIHSVPAGPVGTLPIAVQQLIEIGKILLRNARVVIMDEPNSALSDQETRRLFDVISDMKARGMTIIYVSHRIDEVLSLADRITVLRDGRCIGTLATRETTMTEVVSLMVGRKVDQMFPRKETSREALKEPAVEVRKLSCGRKFRDVSFASRKGEILGVFGLEGSGRTEIAEALLGIRRLESGQILLGGQSVRIRSPFEAIRKGVAYVPPDRKREGLVLGMSVGTNIVLSTLGRLARFGVWLPRGAAWKVAQSYATDLAVRCQSMSQKAVSLSGGNQQKVVLAKGLSSRPNVIILNEPTRGIDVGAKQEIYKLILRLAAEGMSVVFLSSELPEIMALSDRILVVRDGTIVAELFPEKTTRDEVLAMACGSA